MQSPKAIQNFPDNYRSEEMQILARWIRAGESGSVVGLVGCGRTNLLDFLCYRPNILQTYLPTGSLPVAIIPVDLNQLPANDAATFYRVILRACYWVRERFSPTLQTQITTLYLENRETRDAFMAQSALHEALFTFQAEQIRVALVLNRFDRFCETAKPRMIATLRGLRDSFKETLCFIVGMRQAAAYLPDRQAIGEMYALIDSQTCWVGPMNDSDSRWVIKQATHTAPQPPSEAEIQTILDLSGGFPVLLRSLGYWWLNQAIKPPPDTWLNLLAGEPSFEHRLKDLWQGLTQEEQSALAAVQQGMEQIEKRGNKRHIINKVQSQLMKEQGDILPTLAAKHICYQSEMGWRMVSQLWTDYVRRVGAKAQGRIWLDEKSGETYIGTRRLERLPKKEGILLRFFIRNPHQPHNYEKLAHELWPDEMQSYAGDESYTPRGKDDIFPIIMRLRKIIGDEADNARYIIHEQTKIGGGYRFIPEGRPI